MKTALFLLALSGCATNPRPAETPAPAPLQPRAALVRDTSGERYEDDQKRLIAAWQWDGGN